MSDRNWVNDAADGWLMAFDHEKLDVYRLAVQFSGWWPSGSKEH
jgi:hypothetical protein